MIGCRLISGGAPGRCTLLTVLILLCRIVVLGHDPGLSAADVQLARSGLVANLTFALNDIEQIHRIDSDDDGKISPAEFEAARPRLEALARSALEVRFNGRVVDAADANVELDDSNAVHFRLKFPADLATHLHLRSQVLASLARGHKQYLSLKDERGGVLAERMLDANGDQLEVSLGGALLAGSKRESLRRFLVLGVEHILTGYDHLAFLLALLLAGGSLREVAKIITSFTLAHSITLALATFDLVRIPATVVEPLIAVSIVYVGLENIFRRDLSRRWLLTFVFGLVHGLGFASVLRELSIRSDLSGAVLPLLSFNMGVELGQITIAALVLPLIWKLRRHPSFIVRYVPVCSLLVTLMGGYWLIERTLLK